MGKNVIPELDKLFCQIGQYRTSADYKDLLQFVKRFRYMAPYNAMLLHMQKPGSVYVASAIDWAERFNRSPVHGARPLVVLRPFGPVAFVFDINDTEGEKVPSELTDPFFAEGHVTDYDMRRLIKSLYYSGFDYHEHDYGPGSAGCVERVCKRGEYTTTKKTSEFRIPFGIVINQNMENASKAATVFHELGHVFCGHFDTQDMKYLPQRSCLAMEEKEFEAESVCWIICERLGIDNPSAKYLNEYLKDNQCIPEISIETVLKAAGEIEKIWTGIGSPRKELIIK